MKRKEYKNELGEYHRTDGPAIEEDGNKWWFVNGQHHREDGPAVEYSNGTKFWYLNGKRHREDGPAVIWEDGDKWWYINGTTYSEEEYNQEVIKLKLKRLIEL